MVDQIKVVSQMDDHQMVIIKVIESDGCSPDGGSEKLVMRWLLTRWWIRKVGDEMVAHQMVDQKNLVLR